MLSKSSDEWLESLNKRKSLISEWFTEEISLKTIGLNVSDGILTVGLEVKVVSSAEEEFLWMEDLSVTEQVEITASLGSSTCKNNFNLIFTGSRSIFDELEWSLLKAVSFNLDSFVQ